MNAVELLWCVLKRGDRADAYHLGSEALYKVDSLANGFARAVDVVDDDCGQHVTRRYILSKLPPAFLDLGPIDLLGAQRLAHTEGDHDAARARADDGHLRQHLGDRLFHPEPPAQADR